MPFSNVTKCSHLSLPIIPSNQYYNNIVVLKLIVIAPESSDWQQHVFEDYIKALLALQLVSSQPSVVAIFWFFYMWFGFKDDLTCMISNKSVQNFTT